MKTLIKNAKVVNEGKVVVTHVLIEDELISKISSSISEDLVDRVIEAENCYLIPGVIDDQVHFREPGLTHKGDIETESRAAVAGGTTSFIEQPNTIPNAVTQELLEEKYQIAAQKSFANYSFMMGGTNTNLEELLKTNPRNVAGIKLFLGSSTGNMLVDNLEALEEIFSKTKLLIAVHCEDEETVQKNLQQHIEKYGEDIPVECHPIIRSEEACYLSSSRTIELAKKTGARLHVFHLSTGKETKLFTNAIPLKDKKITAEVCIHHLTFSEADYSTKGPLIKWNPAVKTQKDQDQLWEALLDDRIDVIATDHAPHTLEEKNRKYQQAPSGGPLVQESLLVMWEHHRKGKISVEKIVEKMCHNPAIIFNIEKRGFVKEGYKADLVLIDPHQNTVVSSERMLYKCGWSPLEGERFSAAITHTFVNGFLAYENGKVSDEKRGQRLLFER